MNLSTRAAWLLLTALLAGGCSTPEPQLITYRARIERVDVPWEKIYTPAEGPRPMTYLYLRVEPTTPGGEATSLRLAVVGWYLAGTQGRVGDTVTFEFPGPLPRSGQVWFDALRDYGVAAPQPALPQARP